MSKGLFQFDEYVLDAERLRLSRAGEVIALHPKVAETLLVLLEHSGAVVSKEELMNRLWPDTFVEEANLKQNIYVLRRTLGDDTGEPRYIATVPKRGYRFLAEVRKLEENATTPKATVMEPAPAINRSRRWWLAAAALVVIAAVVAGLSFTRGKPVLTDKDTILLADWDNKTGDAIFDGTLKQGLAVQLQQSPFLNLFPDAQARSTLRLMGRAADNKVTPDIGREICQRQGLKALIVGTIAPLGSHYVITLEAINCQNGDVVARSQSEADSKEQVLQSLSIATSQLRERLGESLGSIQQFDKPLPQVTTSSLEALQAYTLAMEFSGQGKRMEAIPYLKRAIELDPDFAVAYTATAVILFSHGQRELPREYAAKAYALKERTSAIEQFRIASSYFYHSLQDYDKTIEVDELWKQAFPRDILPLQSLSVTYRQIGQYEQALAAAQENMKLTPQSSGSLYNVGLALLRLNRFTEAQEAFSTAIQRRYDWTFVHMQLFQLAFIADDAAAMQQELDWLKGKPDAHFAYIWQGWTALCAGQWRRAQELRQQAFKPRRNEHSEDDVTGIQTLWDALLGHKERAYQATRKPLDGRDPEYLYHTGLALALCGETAATQTFIAEMAKQYPQHTPIKNIWLPVTRAALELHQGNAEAAIDHLRPALRYEAAAEFWPQYLRGQAYLKLKQGHEAAAEFQKILAHRGQAPLSVLYPLAHLGRARAAAMSSDSAQARASYETFRALWKEADADLPMWLAAQKEFDRN